MSQDYRDGQLIRYRSPVLDEIQQSQDVYEILGVSESADAAAIKRAYRRRALESHPDRHSEDERPRAEEAFRRVAMAYEVLGNPDKRSAYDRRRTDARDTGFEVADESSAERDGMSAAQAFQTIIEELRSYAAIFKESEIREHLAEIWAAPLLETLDETINEKIVGAFALEGTPPAIKLDKGRNRLSSVLIVTTFRLTVIVITEHQDYQDGQNVKIKSIGGYHTVLWPSVERLEIEQRGRVDRSTVVQVVTHDDEVLGLRLQPVAFGRLLLIASLWGVWLSAPRKRRGAVWRDLQHVLMTVAMTPVVIAVVGLFSFLGFGMLVVLGGMVGFWEMDSATLDWWRNYGTVQPVLVIAAGAAGYFVNRIAEEYLRLHLDLWTRGDQEGDSHRQSDAQ